MSGPEVLSAEVYWALDVMEKGKGDLFHLMFPDSNIAAKFTCGEDKAVYLTTFGIATHFSSLLLSKVKCASDDVLLFDESLNRPLQSKQLDVHIRFWDGDHVSTRFFDSFTFSAMHVLMTSTDHYAPTATLLGFMAYCSYQWIIECKLEAV